eukprot:4888433-Ditylum_brightwellii.AAC.1
MRKFLGIFHAMIQAPKKGGVGHVFDRYSDGIYPAPDLGWFGLKHWCFKELLACWTYTEVPEGIPEEDLDTYWATDQLVDHFNKHCHNNFEHGWLVTVDERIFWGWARDLPDGGHSVDRKPRGF